MIHPDNPNNEWEWFSYSAKTHMRCGFVLKLSDHVLDMEEATEEHEKKCDGTRWIPNRIGPRII